jgi:membrane-bound lytic murein transglycosylase D
MDYFDVAAETETAAREQWAAEQTRPAPTAPSITVPRDPASAPSTLRFQVVRERVQRSAATKSAWARRIAARPPPARAAELAPPLKEIFRAEGLPPEMVWLAEVESSFDPQAQSPVGARGLFQFMPATAQRFGLKTFPVDERTDPAKSGRAAAQYLRVLHARFGDWPLALAAYNAGEGRVGRTLEGSKARSFDGIAAQLPAETRLYVPKVMATVAAREGVDPFALPAPKELPPAVKPPASPAAVGAAAPAKSAAPALPVVAAEAGPLRAR